MTFHPGLSALSHSFGEENADGLLHNLVDNLFTLSRPYLDILLFWESVPGVLKLIAQPRSTISELSLHVFHGLFITDLSRGELKEYITEEENQFEKPDHSK